VRGASAVANRIGRTEYLCWNVATLFGFSLLLVLTVLFTQKEKTTHYIIEAGLVVYAYFKLAVLIPKRLHDMNDSGWWTLIFLLPLIDAAFELVLIFKPGTRDANKYGSVPRTWPWDRLPGATLQ
jgi:uncharacterized membrane protein YhaH (DUF805 family)